MVLGPRGSNHISYKRFEVERMEDFVTAKRLRSREMKQVLESMDFLETAGSCFTKDDGR